MSILGLFQVHLGLFMVHFRSTSAYSPILVQLLIFLFISDPFLVHFKKLKGVLSESTFMIKIGLLV